MSAACCMAGLMVTGEGISGSCQGWWEQAREMAGALSAGLYASARPYESPDWPSGNIMHCLECQCRHPACARWLCPALSKRTVT